jgi:hypothetical protein
VGDAAERGAEVLVAATSVVELAEHRQRPARRRTSGSEPDQWSGMARGGRPELYGRGGGRRRGTAAAEAAVRAAVGGAGLL